MEILKRGHADRAGLEAYIAESYAKAYGASIAHYADQLVGVRGADGAWLAGLGYTLAGRGRLFVEQYLDERVEDAIGSVLNVPIARDQTSNAAFGSLASVSLTSASASQSDL